MSTKKIYPDLKEGQDVIIDKTGEKGQIIKLPQHHNTWFKIQVYPETEPRSLRITDFRLTTDPERTEDTKYKYNVLRKTPININEPVKITSLGEGQLIPRNDPQFQETLEMMKLREFTNSPPALPPYGDIEELFEKEKEIHDDTKENQDFVNGGKKKKRKTKKNKKKKRKTKKN